MECKKISKTMKGTLAEWQVMVKEGNHCPGCKSEGCFGCGEEKCPHCGHELNPYHSVAVKGKVGDDWYGDYTMIPKREIDMARADQIAEELIGKLEAELRGVVA